MSGDAALLLAALALFLLVLAAGGAVVDRLYPPEWWEARARNRPRRP